MTMLFNILTNKFFDTFVTLVAMFFLSKRNPKKYQYIFVIILFGILTLGAILSFKNLAEDFLADIQCATISANHTTTSNRKNSNFTVLKHLSKIMVPAEAMELCALKPYLSYIEAKLDRYIVTQQTTNIKNIK